MGTRGVLRMMDGGRLGFWCPGCKEIHVIDSGIWAFDGNYDKPTFSPSVLIRSGHYIQPGPTCWCTYSAKEIAAGRPPAPFECMRCHSFVRGGRIEFLSDSTHALAGQTVDLTPAPAATDKETPDE